MMSTTPPIGTVVLLHVQQSVMGQAQRRGRINRRDNLSIVHELRSIPLDHLPNVCLTTQGWDALVTLRNNQSAAARAIDDAHCSLYGHEYVAIEGARVCRTCSLYRRLTP
jgi:hypothetical protein